jgi:hypothetical protein
LLTDISTINIAFLADVSDVAQTPHPVFGIAIGIGLFILLLYKVFKSNDSTNYNSDATARVLCPICLGKGTVCENISLSKCSCCNGGGMVDKSVFEYKSSPPIDTTQYGKHEFSRNGFSLKCGWEREFLVKTNRSKCEEKKEV